MWGKAADSDSVLRVFKAPNFSCLLVYVSIRALKKSFNRNTLKKLDYANVF